MNLHIVPDDKYINRLIERIDKLGLGSSNKYVVKRPGPFKHIHQPSVSGAQVASKEFKDLAGDFSAYAKIFIHFMDESCIDLIVQNNLRNVYWLPWGADVYESLFGSLDLLDSETNDVLGITVRNRINRSLYKTVEKLSKSSKYRDAYSRIGALACWIDGEYDYAVRHLPGLKASRKVFMYDVDVAFTEMAKSIPVSVPSSKGVRVLLGQSATPAGNQASALAQFATAGDPITEVVIPVSYGSPDYAKQLESWTAKQKFPFTVTFLKSYHPFKEYVDVLTSFDVIMLNSLRPAGMGNFWLGIFLGKAVILRQENLAFGMLRNLGLTFFSYGEWKSNGATISTAAVEQNRKVCLEFFSEKRISELYTDLFK